MRPAGAGRAGMVEVWAHHGEAAWPLALQVRVAGSFAARWRGLLGRTGLQPGEGLWLPGVRGIHTFGMKFAIDALFLDWDGLVLRVRARVAPGRLAGPVPGAASCLELAAGETGRAGVRPGHRLVWRPGRS